MIEDPKRLLVIASSPIYIQRMFTMFITSALAQIAFPPRARRKEGKKCMLIIATAPTANRQPLLRTPVDQLCRRGSKCSSADS